MGHSQNPLITQNCNFSSFQLVYMTVSLCCQWFLRHKDMRRNKVQISNQCLKVWKSNIKKNTKTNQTVFLHGRKMDANSWAEMRVAVAVAARFLADCHCQFQPEFLSLCLFYINYWAANLLCRPSETLQRRHDSFIYYSRAPRQRSPSGRARATAATWARVRRPAGRVHACVRHCVSRGLDAGVACEFWAALAGGGGGAGLGHVNILINMRESITEEARA